MVIIHGGVQRKLGGGPTTFAALLCTRRLTRRSVQGSLRSVATETCGQLKPLKFSRTVCVY